MAQNGTRNDDVIEANNTMLPVAASSNDEIESLVLENCEISNIFFEGLRNLKFLSLISCNLERIDYFPPSLLHLDLAHNNLSSLPELECLSYLNIRHNNFEVFDQKLSGLLHLFVDPDVYFSFSEFPRLLTFNAATVNPEYFVILFPHCINGEFFVELIYEQCIEIEKVEIGGSTVAPRQLIEVPGGSQNTRIWLTFSYNKEYYHMTRNCCQVHENQKADYYTNISVFEIQMLEKEYFELLPFKCDEDGRILAKESVLEQRHDKILRYGQLPFNSVNLNIDANIMLEYLRFCPVASCPAASCAKIEIGELAAYGFAITGLSMTYLQAEKECGALSELSIHQPFSVQLTYVSAYSGAEHRICSGKIVFEGENMPREEAREASSGRAVCTYELDLYCQLERDVFYDKSILYDKTRKNEFVFLLNNNHFAIGCVQAADRYKITVTAAKRYSYLAIYCRKPYRLGNEEPQQNEPQNEVASRIRRLIEIRVRQQLPGIERLQYRLQSVAKYAPEITAELRDDNAEYIFASVSTFADEEKCELSIAQMQYPTHMAQQRLLIDRIICNQKNPQIINYGRLELIIIAEEECCISNAFLDFKEERKKLTIVNDTIIADNIQEYNEKPRLLEFEVQTGNEKVTVNIYFKKFEAIGEMPK